MLKLLMRGGQWQTWREHATSLMVQSSRACFLPGIAAAREHIDSAVVNLFSAQKAPLEPGPGEHRTSHALF